MLISIWQGMMGQVAQEVELSFWLNIAFEVGK